MLLGDAIAWLLSKLGFRKCTGCERRRLALNAWHAGLTRPSKPEADIVTHVRRRDGRRITFRERPPLPNCPKERAAHGVRRQP